MIPTASSRQLAQTLLGIAEDYERQAREVEDRRAGRGAAQSAAAGSGR